MDILEEFCWMASSEVDEKMQTMEASMSMSTIIHTTLSPSRLSTKFQNLCPFFFSIFSLGFYRALTASLNFSPLSS